MKTAAIVEYDPCRDLLQVTAMVAAKLIKELAAQMPAGSQARRVSVFLR